jgi:Outer membrane protein beta-barrel domain
MFVLRRARLLRAPSAASLVLFVVFLVGGVPAWAQPNPGVHGSLARRIDFGARGYVLILPLIKADSATEFLPSPVTNTSITSTAVKNRLGGGPTIQVYLTNKIAISADLIFRRAGYQQQKTVVVGDVTDVNATITTTTTFERTRVNYRDLPVLVRYYFKPLDQKGPWVYFLGGGTLRHASSVSTFNEVYTPDNTIETNSIPAPLTNKTVMGGTVGFGVQIVDDYGIKMMPEFRYTRWMKEVFGTPPAASKKDQFEIVFGITW